MRRPALWKQILGHIWMLPLTLIGILMIAIYVPTSIRFRDGRIEIVPLWIAFSPGAQTFGNIVFFCHRNARNDDDLVVHECVHIAQAMKYGVFYGLGYPLEAALQWIKNPSEPSGEPRWYRAYMAISWERAAYRAQEEYRQGLRPWAWGAA